MATVTVTRQELIDSVRARQAELERTILTRICGINDPAEVSDPSYGPALRATVKATIEYGFECLASQADAVRQPPVRLLTQARVAAQNRVSLDTVLRRYLAGYSLFNDFLIAEACSSVAEGELKAMLRTNTAVFDRLIEAITSEYRYEVERCAKSSERRITHVLGQLLAGELADTSDIAYDFGVWHLGLVAKGAGASDAVRRLAGELDRRSLIAPGGDETVWAWLGGREGIDPAEVRRAAAASWPRGVPLGVGEAVSEVAGWRLTHRQALAALAIARRQAGSIVHYADVALLVSAMKDDLLTASLHELYLAPLERQRDGGDTARSTVRAYLSASGNATSAAAALGVSRQAVNDRLRVVEQCIGRPLDSCAAELRIALGLEQFEAPFSSQAR